VTKRGHLKALLFAPLLFAGTMRSGLAGDYNPIPPAWNIKINLPGTLSVGAEYCTQMGQCKYVGDNIVGFSIGGTPVGGIQGCQSLPDAEPCLRAKIPVFVLVASEAGSIIIRLNGRNYAVGGTQWYKRETNGRCIGGPVSVVNHGVNVPAWLFLHGLGQECDGPQ
jgi:hypothetical protein